MAQYGYGSGGYLTRFEDYYKSSDESDDEGVNKDVKGTESLTASFDISKYILEESEDEDGLVERERKPQIPPDDQLSGAEKDWVPQSLNDLKMTIKPPKNFKGYDEEAYQGNSKKMVK